MLQPSLRSTMLPRWVFALCLAGLVLASPSWATSSPAAILVVGDSISAGYGLPGGTSWVDLLRARLEAEHYATRVVNASISGDTTAGGRQRLPPLLRQYHPALVVIELGGNDGLRGGSLDAMRDNLETMTAAAKKSGAKVLIVGMELPPNYGPSYVKQFREIYGEVAKKHDVALVPFLLSGFAEDTALFQADRIHPTVAAQPRLLDNVWPTLKALLVNTRR